MARLLLGNTQRAPYIYEAETACGEVIECHAFSGSEARTIIERAGFKVVRFFRLGY